MRQFLLSDSTKHLRKYIDKTNNGNHKHDTEAYLRPYQICLKESFCKFTNYKLQNVTNVEFFWNDEMFLSKVEKKYCPDIENYNQVEYPILIFPKVTLLCVFWHQMIISILWRA